MTNDIIFMALQKSIKGAFAMGVATLESESQDGVVEGAFARGYSASNFC